MSFLFKRAIGPSDVYGSHWQAIRGVGGGKDRALAIAAVYGAVSYIADTFATLPQHVYEHKGGARAKVDAPIWLDDPDPNMLGLDWRYQFTTSLKLRGNAYGRVLRNAAGKIIGCVWLHPDKVQVDETGSVPVYRVGGKHEWHAVTRDGVGEILHVREFVQPGSVVGLSPIAHFRDTWETGLQAQRYGREWFEGGATPSSLLTSDKPLGTEQSREAKKLFRQSVADGGPVVLGSGWDYTKLTVSPDEAQFLQTIRATATTVATIFRVPADEVGGEPGSSRTYGNREADAERFNVRTLLPHSARYEQALKRLLPPGQYVRLNMDGLTRPNLVDRARAQTEQLRNGSLTLAEVRAHEDRAPLTDQEIEQWQSWYVTTKSESESIAESVSESITKEG